MKKKHKGIPGTRMKAHGGRGTKGKAPGRSAFMSTMSGLEGSGPTAKRREKRLKGKYI